MVTELEYNATKQNFREIEITVNLLNYKFQKVDELSGVVVGSPSYTIDADSDIRRTLNIAIVPTNSTFIIDESGKIWLDKYVQPIIKIKDQITDEYATTKLGIYIIDNPTTAYSKDENTITLSCYDLMAKLTGLRNGNLEGVPHQIPANSNVREAMVELITMAGFERYVIDECTFDVPNDILVDIGGTVYDLMKALVDIDTTFQIYFDVDGVFHYNKRPIGVGQQVIINDDIWEKVLISYQKSYNFDSVKNSITVIGKTHDINYMATNEVVGTPHDPDRPFGDCDYKLVVPDVTEYYDGLLVGFKVESYALGSGMGYIQINDLPLIPFDGFLEYGEMEDYYIYKYSEADGMFYNLGHITPEYTIKEMNPESPFYVNGNLGEIRIVLSGGEYENIYSDDLARQRAEYELYKRCRLQDTVSISVVPIYWADVNILIEITLPNEPKNKYLIKNISTDLSVEGTQQINLIRFYEGDYD